jgi:hypothetical protein
MDALTIFLGLLLAVALGLILYTAQMKYSPLEKLLMTMGGAFFILLGLWHSAVRLTWSSVAAFVEPGKLDAAQRAVKGLQVPPMWELAGAGLFGAYWFAVHIRRAVVKARRGGEP